MRSRAPPWPHRGLEHVGRQRPVSPRPPGPGRGGSRHGSARSAGRRPLRTGRRCSARSCATGVHPGGSGFAPVIVNLVTGLADRQRLIIAPRNASGALSRIYAPDLRALDLTTAHTIGFTATAICVEAKPGTYPEPIDVVLGSCHSRQPSFTSPVSHPSRTSLLRCWTASSSTPNSVAAGHHPPNGSSRSSAASPATN